MERSRAVFEASTSGEAPGSDYASLPGYRSSLSYYNQQPSLDRESIDRDGHGGYLSDRLTMIPQREVLGTAADHSSKHYSYASSYDDMSRRYGYGAGGDPFPSEAYKAPDPYPNDAYKGRTFDGTSAYHHGSSYMYSASPRASGFSQDVGLTFGSRQHTFNEEQPIANRYNEDLGNEKSIFDYKIKPDVMLHEPSAVGGASNIDYELSYSLKDYNVHPEQSSTKYYASTRERVVGTMGDASSSYLLGSKHATAPSGLYSPFSDAVYDWRNARDTQRAPDELGWKSLNSFTSDEHEQALFQRAGSSSMYMDGGAYSERRGPSRLSIWDEGAGGQEELDLGQKGNDSLSLLHKEHIANGSKVATVRESSTPGQGAGLSKLTNEGKKRKTRWEPVEENEKSSEDDIKKQKRKTRWSAEKSPVKEISVPNITKEIPDGSDDIVALKARLMFINKMLQSGRVFDDPNAERSPSPEPILDNFGFRVNTREYRAREKLNKERQKILSRLSETLAPSQLAEGKLFKSGKPSKFSKKVYIPVDKHPEYNFVGLIIGPRGHTQKKMEKESGAKINIRGKSSVKEGAQLTHAPFRGNDNLHVLIEADSEDAINKASEMVEKILVPVKDGKNLLKKAQLRELAAMNGTLRSNDECPVLDLVVGQTGGAPTDNEVCHACKGPGPKHLRNECPMLCSISGPNSLKGESKGEGNAVSVVANTSVVGNDKTELHVAYLPWSVDDTHLLNLFSPFGQIVDAKVIKNPTTGMSKCYGFVKFFDAADAAQAAALMNGYQMEGKALAVHFKTKSELGS